MQFSTKGTNMGVFVSWVVAFPIIAFNIVFDADFTIVGCTEGAVGELCPCRLPIIKLGWAGVIAVMEDTMPPLTAEYAAQREGVPLAARRKET